MRSIRSRTLVLVLGLLGVSLTLMSLKGYRDAHHEIEELFDAQLAHSARLLQGLAGQELDETARHRLQAALDQAVGRHDASGARPPGHPYESKLAFQIFDAAGRPLLQSAGAPPDALEHLLRQLAPAAAHEVSLASLDATLPGYHDLFLNGHVWRLFILHDRPADQWLLVSERGDVRGELVGKIALHSLLPDVVGLPLLALLVWLAVGWGLRPLVRMVHLLKGRDADNLAPLLLAPLPQELEPVVASLNRLLQQVTNLLEREKRFIADAAHELRTPLAVLRIHAQNARQATDPQDRDKALDQLIDGVDRATRVVTQMLTLARLEPQAMPSAGTRFDFRRLLRETLAELAPLALARDQELTLDVDETSDFQLFGQAPALATLLQNLVGNALQYTPPGGHVQVGLERVPGHLLLCVADSGPGVPPELRPRLFQRFFRQGEGQGAGLGLSIVARIAELHGAQVTLHDSPLGGLEVRVRLPCQSA